MGHNAVRVTAVAAALALAACETPPTKEQVGAVSGAVIGGVVGSTIGGGSGRTVAIVAGTIAGAVLGGKIGQKMDEADRIKAGQALETVPTGHRSSWKNPDTGAAARGSSNHTRLPLPQSAFAGRGIDAQVVCERTETSQRG